MTDTPSDPPQYPTQPGPPPDQYPPGQYPPGGYPAAPRRRNGMGTAALVLGVLALVLVLLLIFSPLGAFLGLLAVIFGIVGIVRANRREADNRGQAVTGLITGGLALLLGIFFTISVGVWFSTHVNDFNRFGQCLDDATGQAAREECAQELGRNLE
jgi:Na+/H+ antiporter NhaD/arsenite permease-like protein